MVRQKEGAPCCTCPCPCEGLVDVIGKKWVLCALAQLGNEGTLRFNQLAQKLPGISAKTLSDVLKDLQRNGLVRRVAYQEIPPRVEYFLTREGRELTMLVAPLMAARDAATDVVTSESALAVPYFATSFERRRTSIEDSSVRRGISVAFIVASWIAFLRTSGLSLGSLNACMTASNDSASSTTSPKNR